MLWWPGQIDVAAQAKRGLRERLKSGIADIPANSVKRLNTDHAPSPRRALLRHLP